MRLTIARKIALAVTALVILCVGTMAWVTSSNLQRGFVAYLNELQTQDLDQLRQLLEDRYRLEGSFDWLRRQPRAFKSVLDQMKPRILAEVEERGGPPPRATPPPGEAAAGAPDRARGQDPDELVGADGDAGEAGDAGEQTGRRPPPRARYGMRPPPRPDEPPPRLNETLPRLDEASPRLNETAPRGQEAPSRREEASPRRDQAAPPAEDDEPQGRRAEGRPPRHDPIGFASRISIVDAEGRVVIGPPDFPPGIERDIKVDGRVVGRMRLMPLRQASGSDPSATVFLRGQLQTILLLAVALIALALLAAIWLARHLLRPVAELHKVTAKLAQGQFSARAPLVSRDELADLARDVNAMAEALERSEGQRRRMLADISHELRTPLTVLRGEIEAQIDGIRLADNAALESLHGEVLRLGQLLDDLQQLALADAGELHYQWRTLDLAALLTPLLERYQGRAAKAGLRLEWTTPAAPLALTGDGGRLTQVLANLLENSLRYTDAGGRIVLALTRDGAWAELSIADSAPGVPVGAHASIFERLYRVDTVRTRGRGGSGLGLAICKVLLEAHGGNIVALPSALGGLNIVLRLPLGPPARGPANQPSMEQHG
ncbi:ATP-binding protein [Rugamonas sp. CCM 8940]|uniref:ATP-binding protein n=1 Tax=Rugamonas sp. CCM 8940 TaxID=2765359 RepID=UPI0018F51463|nr:ATP-binding protein [Rugamonas sp. CCM 8940]MBJ7313229.1 HAMP domain-containing protein [Rugamonas sp. CCM 8940]